VFELKCKKKQFIVEVYDSRKLPGEEMPSSIPVKACSKRDAKLKVFRDLLRREIKDFKIGAAWKKNYVYKR
jgi:hypothetical protein